MAEKPQGMGDFERYMKHTASDRTRADLLERLYHRMYIAKTCGKLQGDMDYMRFLPMAIPTSLKSVQTEVGLLVDTGPSVVSEFARVFSGVPLAAGELRFSSFGRDAALSRLFPSERRALRRKNNEQKENI